MGNRIDQRLVELGLARSRSQAQALIDAGRVMLTRPACDPEPARRSSLKIGPEVLLSLSGDPHDQPVSRGALKLRAIIDAAGPHVAGKLCIDAGQSTGGFTECLLEHGAAWVVGLEVGHGQLAGSLRDDPRVFCFEHTNVRHCTRQMLVEKLTDAAAPEPAMQLAGEGADLIVADLSFISLRKVLQPLSDLLARDGALLALVKPQFELGPGAVNKRGIVTDINAQNHLHEQFSTACRQVGLTLHHWIDSPITGGDGNREFLLHAKPNSIS